MKRFVITVPIPQHYGFETYIDVEDLRPYAAKYWHYSVYLSIIYVAVIHYLQHYMKYRPAFDLRRATVYWNCALALFSICCTVRGITALIYGIKYVPFYYMICDNTIYTRHKGFMFWTALYLLSKVVEFGDTVLIVLRKRNLLFLHWYHHMATLIIIWYGAYREITFGYLICYFNVFVHSFMYSYFALKAMNIKMPKKFAMFITTIQILQMAWAVLTSCWVYWLIINNYECDVSKEALDNVFLLVSSYLILFCKLFYESYIKRCSRKKIN
ncbi:elongation of very long chain fatty acids protein 6-like isoform X2 [Centruroides sculpturatus]|nr:elongation of very long chain fatty acids protein 6-like isoform X2 [Centruroides sculpturatus]